MRGHQSLTIKNASDAVTLMCSHTRRRAVWHSPAPWCSAGSWGPDTERTQPLDCLCRAPPLHPPWRRAHCGINTSILQAEKDLFTCSTHLACFRVWSNVKKSLSLSAWSVQNIDSWNPGGDLSLLVQQNMYREKKKHWMLNIIKRKGIFSEPNVCSLTSLTAHSPTRCSSRLPGSAALSAPLPTPPPRSPSPAGRWWGCCSDRSSADPVGDERTFGWKR